ncbi:acid phosphatase [Altererythrobacter aurantiacus]|uniref:Acid phosphatase n=1 Tax=Parapontixanthobacter aurantiacus TaxID=1463599 RepID=A0A844ZFV9_9SPHN|nr:HAD family acid phosphatase [Parapontixanthobacter aurantiacus]MXO86233.1 acid phosphatase [Parapontixanthobacter aurantiacus]
MKAPAAIAGSLLALQLAGCATVPDDEARMQAAARDAAAAMQSVGETMQAVSAEPADPLEADAPDTMRWLYGSGEAAGASIQTYRALIDFAVAKARQRSIPQSVVMGLPESDNGLSQASCMDGSRLKPLAVIFDVDETVLLNLGAEYDQAVRGAGFDPDRWDAWERSGGVAIAPVPGAVTALRELRDAGITPIFNTNRNARNAVDTEQALNAAGLGPARHGETLFLKGDDASGSAKDLRRAAIAKNYCVIALAGDNLGDFADRFNDPELSVQDRRRLAGRGEYAALWGNGWFLLPNPVYGASIKGTIGEVFPPDARWQPDTTSESD